jgi:hypothetical protein
MDDDIHGGGCLCGAVRYRLRGQPKWALVCHCRYCQRRLGTAFATIGYYDDAAIVSFDGAQTEHPHRSDESGRLLTMGFCTTCGTTVTTRLERRPGMVGIALGTLDEPDRVPIGHHIWLRSKRPWVAAPPDVLSHECGLAAAPGAAPHTG